MIKEAENESKERRRRDQAQYLKGTRGVYWLHLILSADYMLNINSGKMSDEPVPHFSTATGNFLIFIKTVADHWIIVPALLYPSQRGGTSH